MAYRISRNFEASIIQFIKTQLSGSWTGVSVEKTFAKVYDIDLPVICVRCGNTAHRHAQIGDDSTVRTATILIDIFGTSSGLSLDLKDFLIEKLKGGLVYYEYTIVSGQIDTKTANGRIRVLTMEDVPVDFEIEKSKLEPHDRHRWLITLDVSLGQVEA